MDELLTTALNFLLYTFPYTVSIQQSYFYKKKKAPIKTHLEA